MNTEKAFYITGKRPNNEIVYFVEHANNFEHPHYLSPVPSAVSMAKRYATKEQAERVIEDLMQHWKGVEKLSVLKDRNVQSNNPGTKRSVSPLDLTSTEDLREAMRLSTSPSALHSLSTYQIRGGGSKQTHFNILAAAIGRNEPVNWSWVEDHDQDIPNGYEIRGRLLFPVMRRNPGPSPRARQNESQAEFVGRTIKENPSMNADNYEERNLDDPEEIDTFIAQFGTVSGMRLANMLGISGRGAKSVANNLSAYVWNKRTAMRQRAIGDIKSAQMYEQICESIYDELPDEVKW